MGGLLGSSVAWMLKTLIAMHEEGGRLSAAPNAAYQKVTSGSADHLVLSAVASFF